MNDDPFSAAADPGVSIQGRRAVQLGRRDATRLLILGTALAVTAGCAHSAPRIACNVKQSDPGSCRHQFCRHHRR